MEPGANHPSPSNPKVLVIDDEPSALKLVRALLTDAAYDVTVCDRPSEGLKLLSQMPVDCVITDAMMPEMSGLELVRSIRSQPSLARIPILMLTRKRQREDVTSAIQAGVTDYVLKPVDEQLLLDKIELCLSKGLGRKFVFRHFLNDARPNAGIQLEASIVSISESDMVLHTHCPAHSKLRFRLDSRIFAEIGIRQPEMAFVSCRPLSSNVDSDFEYEVTYSFVGVPEEDLRKIRGWVRMREIQRRK